ncbi:hypothetical protein C4D60_Mb07t25100 [Musa balbisiana]|uniref:Uncharacterized protein n=1 Tax=Musa balbisiana TaxID=52838 RepID=A0A4S8JHU7_MUSBA|nr:hypothetical protein C4D60_Mb07t25100 [Musa balbisiana]
MELEIHVADSATATAKQVPGDELALSFRFLLVCPEGCRQGAHLRSHPLGLVSLRVLQRTARERGEWRALFPSIRARLSSFTKRLRSSNGRDSESFRRSSLSVGRLSSKRHSQSGY